MSKKKNTLKDLDDFLKQQAAVIVPPVSLNNKTEEPYPESPSSSSQEKDDLSTEKIIRELTLLSRKEGDAFSGTLCDIILQSLKNSHTTPEEKMLINTALYLKNKNNWKDAIRSYWKEKGFR